MPLNRSRVKEAVRSFNFDKLFIEELGWDRHKIQPLTVLIEAKTYSLSALAEKRGMVAFLCEDADGVLPDSATRRKIELQVRRAAHEHVIIFVDADHTIQTWQWVKREPGKPAACREHVFHVGQPGDALVQKLEAISFGLDEEEALTITTVAGRARQAFDVDRVTKRFYEQFTSEHKAFLDFIKGIQAQGDREWYASLMLNRLMFTYFIQKKGFLDGDRNYLRNRLQAMRARKGKDRFHSFYRYFLLRLFHEGLGKIEHPTELEHLLGRVPFLNGGLFDVHLLERENERIEIADEAFESIFDFFDSYQWHLDERPLRADNEINPDVLGYIFEKYINQKQMGAYYTREDITEYMARETVVPFLLERAKNKCEIAFENKKGPTVWDLLRDDPDRYIPAPVAYGSSESLPKNPALESLEQADTKVALPGETWREVLARRDRYDSLKSALSSGRIELIDDLVSNNLDVRQFAQDVIENSEGPALLRAFWNAIEKITILDPTCGSGAFLFAALNILEPLYEACLDRMEAFVQDVEQSPKKTAKTGDVTDFRAILDRVRAHPNRRYFIFKNIILNNLFGVDIMDEAVEICKLRLFLKLAAQVEPDASHPNLGIEPLPDIDFNIKAGNTLVGFARYNDVEEAVGATFDFENALTKIRDRAEQLQSAFDAFRAEQTEAEGVGSSKADLRERLAELNNELNEYLAAEYGVKRAIAGAFETWLETHRPFHWFVEFYGIMSAGGFDVVIGNPPYVQWSKVKDYKVRRYQTASCPDIYAACVERSIQLLAPSGAFSMILPISFQFSSDFEIARRVCKAGLRDIWVSTYSRNPSALFSAGLGVRSTICIGRSGHEGGRIRSSVLHRWIEEFRPVLFDCVRYQELPTSLEAFGWPRLDSSAVASLFDELVKRAGRLHSGPGGSHQLRFKSTALYYISAFIEDPPSFDGKGRPIAQTKVGALRFRDKESRDLALVVALGKMGLLWWAATGDDFDVTGVGLGSTPLDANKLGGGDKAELLRLSSEIERALEKNVIYTKYAGKWMGNYDIKYVREATDVADQLMLKALGLERFWGDIETAYARFMKMTGERPGTVREIPDFSKTSKASRAAEDAPDYA